MGMTKYARGFRYTEHPDEIELPLGWKKSRRIFVNSMSDLFHEKSSFEFVGKCFTTMLRADWHVYQILTKRPDRMAEFSDRVAEYIGGEIPAFIWMGTSIESAEFVYRMDILRKTKCKTRFVSLEPLLGPVGKLDLGGINWVIIGGESGSGHRPIRKEWIEEIIDQCKSQKVSVFFKQWGGARPKSGGRSINGRTYSQYPRVSKKNPYRNADLKGLADACIGQANVQNIQMVRRRRHSI